MKFGGASVATPEAFATIASIIKKRLSDYRQIVVVVSAMGKTTDELLGLAKRVHPSPPKREGDMLISVGERISIALLAMALDLKGVEAISFTGSQSGIITSEEHSQAYIIDVKPYRIERELAKGKVVIVAGFQGVSRSGEITTLGRGGSDTSAVALAIALKADHVEFYKDVRGIGERDPNLYPDAKIYEKLDYEQLLEIIRRGAKVLHERCVELAQINSIPLQVWSFYNPEQMGTLIEPNQIVEGEMQFEMQKMQGSANFSI